MQPEVLFYLTFMHFMIQGKISSVHLNKVELLLMRLIKSDQVWGQIIHKNTWK